MWNSIVAMVVLPISFYVGSHWGTGGIAAIWVVIYPVVQYPLFKRVFRRIDFPLADYMKAVWPALSGCIVMAVSIWGMKSVSNGRWPLYVRLASEILVGMIAYGLVLLLMHRNYLQGFLKFVRASRLQPTAVAAVPAEGNTAV